MHEQLGIDKSELTANSDLCRKNVDTAVHSLRLCFEPSVDACQAVILGAAIAMEEAKAATAWRLTATASRMCLDLGLHRLPSGEDVELRRKRMIFWYVYSMDKGLAFNFGRTPTIHDYDITVDRPTLHGDLDGPLASLYIGMLEFSILEGDIYEQLFSVSAQRLSAEVRIERARAFAQKLEDLRPPLLEALKQKDQPLFEQAKFTVLTSDMILYWRVPRAFPGA